MRISVNRKLNVAYLHLQDEPGPPPRDACLKQMIRIAVGTAPAAFGGELLNLQWADVDVGAGRLVVRNRDGFTARNGNEPVFRDANDDVPKPVGSPSGSSSTSARRSSPTGRSSPFIRAGTQPARGSQYRGCRSV